MKTFRISGAVLFVFGLIFALVGILSSFTPLIQSEHFKLILNSFQETSADALTNTLNSVVRFCLRSGYFLLFFGIVLMIAGGLISSSAHKKQWASAAGQVVQPVSPPAAETLGVPRPAYYPGGLAPPVITFSTKSEEVKPAEPGFEAAQKLGPISGGVEPSFSTEESEAQRLMQHDELISSRKQTRRPPAHDYAQYPSNSAPAETRREPVLAAAADLPHRPKIVSTMGKKRG